VPRPTCHTSKRETCYPLCRRLGGAPRLVWMSVENPAPTRIQPLDHPACNELGTYCKKTWEHQCNKITFENIFLISVLNVVSSVHKTVYMLHFNYVFLITACLYHKLIILAHFKCLKLEFQADGHARCIFLFCECVVLQ